jgi:hypothetical protein
MATLLLLSLLGHFFHLELGLDLKMLELLIEMKPFTYIDPGRSQCFTAMKRISGPGNPTLIMKLSNGEYKHMASIKLLEKARHGLKVEENFAHLDLLPEFKVQYIESLMSSKKTMHQDRYLEYMEFVWDHCSLLTDFYDQRFNKFKFWGYCGRQRALSEVCGLSF